MSSLFLGDGCWFMATDGVSIFHPGLLPVGYQLDHGQPYTVKAMTESDLFDKVFIDPVANEDGSYSVEGQTARPLSEIEGVAL